MSCTTSVTSQPSAPAAFQSAIMVGDTTISSIVSKGLSNLNVRVETDPHCETIRDQYVFGRDSRVILSDGTHLVPYPIRDPLLGSRLKTLMTESSNHFITSRRNGFGNGFSEENVAAAHKTAELFKIPAKQATTCIEGGNCFITDSGAIVGIHSVGLSLIALEEQGCFEDEKIQKRVMEITTPDPQFLRMARNCAIYAEKRPLDEKLIDVRGDSPLKEEIKRRWGGETGFRSLLATPFAKEDAATYCEAAKILQAKWEFTLSCIATELGIEEKNLAIVDQNEFHIDMEMALSPDGRLFVHDPNQAHFFLDAQVRRARGDSLLFYRSLQKYSNEHSAREFATMQNNLPKLTPLGLRVITLPAAYSSEVEKLNFINGIFIKTADGMFFLTNGAKRKGNVFMGEFEASIIDHKIQPLFFDELQQVLNLNHGGLHCLTWTRPISDEGTLAPSSNGI